MRRKRILRRIAASAVALSMMAALSAPAFAATFNISNGGLVIEANHDGSVTVWQDGCSGSSGSMTTVDSGEEIEITGSINMADSKYAPTSESLASNSEIYYPTTEKEAEEPDTEEQQTQKEAEKSDAEEPKTQEKAEEPAAEEQQTQKKAEESDTEEQKTQKKADEPDTEEQQLQKKAEDKKEASASAEATATAEAGGSSANSVNSSRIRTGVIEIINNTAKKLKLTFNNVTVRQEKAAGSGGGGAAGAGIGTPGQLWGSNNKDDPQPELAAGTEAAPDTSDLTNGSVVIEPSTPPAPDHVHIWERNGSENVDEGLVRTHYTCACGASKTELAAPRPAAPASGGSSAVTLTVTGAEAYETSIVDGRYTVAVPAETAVLSGCLSNLKELKAQGADTIVFRTQLRETVLNIDSMLSLGVDDTLFTLTHNGEGASLTIGGFEHNELIH